MTYCEYIGTMAVDQLTLYKECHDNHYGFPLENDDELFEIFIPVALFMNTLNY